jgi:hypothetical protein
MCAHPLHRVAGEDVFTSDLRPQVAEAVGCAAWVLGEHRAVDRPHRRSDDEIRTQLDLGQRLKHADLHRAEAGAASKHDTDRPRHRGGQ